MMIKISDLHIAREEALPPPSELHATLPVGDAEALHIARSRGTVQQILAGGDDRLLVIAGPCSIHEPESALEYARRLRDFAPQVADALFLVMRVYFEKPRTRLGWKGLIYDPDLDGRGNIRQGLSDARRLLLECARLGVPAGSEILDLVTPQYYAELLAWGAIGARTTESQIHRELASGLSCPVGFKNGTDGSVHIAADAVKAASHPHHFIAVTKGGRSAIAATTGNQDCHIILRGGRAPNYDSAGVDAAAAELARSGVAPRIMIDASHANSNKKPENQPLVIADVARQISAGERRIIGAMVESNLVAGRQDVQPGVELTYGQSITDGCIDWETTELVHDRLADSVADRRKARREKVRERLA